ncbi:uncharacterized protein LOC142610419 [Castanea sativa]|uniref:uncharacterized protein LOC142610419 n=1 Tax=Castanea sativa TaxID=21020 RepID=UPI003F64F2C0
MVVSAAQELEKDLHGPAADSLPAEKRLAIFDKIFTAYHEARSCIRSDLVSAGNAENVKDDLNGLDKAVSAVLGQRTIERNQLLVTLAKSKLTRRRDDKNEKVTKPEELVRLYDLLLQNTADLLDLVSSGRDRKPEELAFFEECAFSELKISCDFLNARKEVNQFNVNNRWRKRGIAIVPTKFGISFTAKFMNQAGALVHVYTDGTVLVTHGGVEMGQGLHTKVAQIAASDAMNKMEEESENLHKQLLDRDVDLGTFVKKYKKLRTTYHRRALIHLSAKTSSIG